MKNQMARTPAVSQGNSIPKSQRKRPKRPTGVNPEIWGGFSPGRPSSRLGLPALGGLGILKLRDPEIPKARTIMAGEGGEPSLSP